MSGEDKASNKTQEIKGRAKEATGRATDDERLENEGRADRAKGSAKQAGEKAKDALRGALGKE
ncbi:MAG: CsbD family protein [Actinomycetota bacterium]